MCYRKRRESELLGEKEEVMSVLFGIIIKELVRVVVGPKVFHTKGVGRRGKWLLPIMISVRKIGVLLLG